MGIAAFPTSPSTTPARGAESHSSREIVMLIYPGFTALDLIGPQHVLASLPGRTVHLVAKNREDVTTDTGVVICPTRTFEDCATDPEVLLVPGGTNGTLTTMEDNATIAFLADRGARAGYVTSVCTGSLILGAAGLLRGYKATSHWLTRDLLRDFGAEPVEGRIVIDRNRATGGGVTAGIDFGLSLAARIQDESFARGVQLVMEYDPRPPFQGGSPSAAGAELTGEIREMFAPWLRMASDASKRAARKLSVS